MPFVLGMTGFEARATARDRLTVVSGTASYDTSNLPPDSPSATSFSGVSFRAPWYNDPAAALFVPSTDEFWFHGRYRSNGNTVFNSTIRLGVGTSGSEYIVLSTENSTLKLTLRVAGAVVATATSAAMSIGTFERLHVHVTGALAGDQVLVYMDGDLSTPVLSYTLVGGDATALGTLGLPNEFSAAVRSGDQIDDLVAFDPAAVGFPGIEHFISCGIKGQVVTGDGAEADWSGSYADIDERPASDTDKITAAAVGDESSFTKPAIGEPNVFAVKVMARVTRTGTTAGSNLTTKINDGAVSDEVTMAAPGDGDVQYIFDTAADGGAWSPMKYDATRIAFIAAT
jgi:hypothetical protein